MRKIKFRGKIDGNWWYVTPSDDGLDRVLYDAPWLTIGNIYENPELLEEVRGK